MINILDSFQQYSSNIKILDKSETFESYKLVFELYDIQEELKWDELVSLLPHVNSRDSVTLNLSIDDGDPFSFQINNSTVPDFLVLDSINKNIESDSILKFTYEITKNMSNNIRSIYDTSLIYEYLNSRKLKFLLNIIQKHVDFDQYNVFEVQNDAESKVYFRSNLFIIASQNIQFQNNNPFYLDQRKKTLELRKLNTNPQMLSDYQVIPEDFLNLENCCNDLSNLFNKLKIIFSASFLANASDIVNNQDFQFSFIGHKFVDFKVNFQTTNFLECDVFYKIYQWVYSNEDIHDKLDLSRNIISRYLILETNKLILINDTFNSIQSAHAIYLKENVEKYIETKNKVAEVATELSIKSTEISQFFIAGFKNNNLTVLTFFTSIFIFNSLSDNFLKNLFTGQIYYLSLVFLLISVIYLFIIRCQLMNDLKKNIVYFYRIKRIYRDLFDKKELNNLFNYRHLRDTKKYVLNTVKRYTFLWLIEVLILLITIIFFNLFL